MGQEVTSLRFPLFGAGDRLMTLLHRIPTFRRILDDVIGGKCTPPVAEGGQGPGCPGAGTGRTGSQGRGQAGSGHCQER